MLHFSSYSVLSERLVDGRYVLLNTISGALDLLSKELGSAVEEYLLYKSDNKASKIIQSLQKETLSSFKERGHLTHLSKEEEKENVIQIAHALHEMESQQNIHFVIVPNYDCNYRCTYCFERPIQKKLDAKKEKIKNGVLLNNEQIEAIFTHIDTLVKPVKLSKKTEITLYGGEPLDKRNKNTIAKIIEEGKKRNFTYAAITNGHDLDSYIEFLAEDKINRIQITLDGPKEVHNKTRIYRGQESSFDKIIQNIQLVLAKTNTEIQIRVHISTNNLYAFEELLETFSKEGWLNNPQIVIYTSVLYLKNKEGEVFTNNPDHSSVMEFLEALSSPYSNVYINTTFFHTMSALQPAFLEENRYQLHSIYCGANSGMYVFAPDNKIYACWESVGKACSQIGTYDKNSITLDKKMTDQWFNRSIANIPECQSCPYALVCGGGCAQYAQYNTQTLYAPYCDNFQTNFKKALAQTTEIFLYSLDEKEEKESHPILY